jgi:hypothetical protein
MISGRCITAPLTSASIRHFTDNFKLRLKNVAQAFEDNGVVVGQKHTKDLHALLRRMTMPITGKGRLAAASVTRAAGSLESLAGLTTFLPKRSAFCPGLKSFFAPRMFMGYLGIL